MTELILPSSHEADYFFADDDTTTTTPSFLPTTTTTTTASENQEIPRNAPESVTSKRVADTATVDNMQDGSVEDAISPKAPFSSSIIQPRRRKLLRENINSIPATDDLLPSSSSLGAKSLVFVRRYGILLGIGVTLFFILFLLVVWCIPMIWRLFVPLSLHDGDSGVVIPSSPFVSSNNPPQAGYIVWQIKYDASE